jgi:hypothetical protein
VSPQWFWLGHTRAQSWSGPDVNCLERTKVNEPASEWSKVRSSVEQSDQSQQCQRVRLCLRVCRGERTCQARRSGWGRSSDRHTYWRRRRIALADVSSTQIGSNGGTYQPTACGGECRCSVSCTPRSSS